MNIFSVIMLIGGLAFFLYGMHILSSSLERMAGGRLEYALKKMTSNKWKGLLLGAGITIAIQSSSAMTVMLVGLVNSGIMGIEQTVGVIMGSNIGTTLTAWLLSLVGINSDSVWMGLLKPENFSLIFAFIGIVMVMMSKKARRRDIGTALVAFAVLMYGMKLMSDAVSPLAESDSFSAMLTAFKNPLLGILIGALFTGIIQSSAASVGILQALALTGSVTYGMAIPIIMGQNIGTCVTAFISSIGVSKNAKKVSVIHIAFNIIGTAVLLPLYFGLDAIFDFAFTNLPINAAGIALVHSLFNAFTTALLLPFSNLLVKLANRLLGVDKPEVKAASFIDSRLFVTPSVAVSECNSLTSKMAGVANNTIAEAIKLLESFDTKQCERISEQESALDKYEDELGTYLVRLASSQLSDSDSIKVSKMLHTIGDFERLGDHALNILNSAKELNEKGLTFSGEAKAELKALEAAITEIMEITVLAEQNDDVKLARRVEPLEQVIDGIVAKIKSNHINRLKKGECSIELGFILSDLLNNFERISDHCSNIAVAVIELSRHSFDTHKYLTSIKYGSGTFKRYFIEYKEKYNI